MKKIQIKSKLLAKVGVFDIIFRKNEVSLISLLNSALNILQYI